MDNSAPHFYPAPAQWHFHSCLNTIFFLYCRISQSATCCCMCRCAGGSERVPGEASLEWRTGSWTRLLDSLIIFFSAFVKHLPSLQRWRWNQAVATSVTSKFSVPAAVVWVQMRIKGFVNSFSQFQFVWDQYSFCIGYTFFPPLFLLLSSSEQDKKHQITFLDPFRIKWDFWVVLYRSLCEGSANPITECQGSLHPRSKITCTESNDSIRGEKGIHEWSSHRTVPLFFASVSNINPGWGAHWLFSPKCSDSCPKCTFESKDTALKVAAVLDTKQDEKSIFNIFSGSSQAHSFSTNWIMLRVLFFLLTENRSVFLMKCLLLFGCFGERKRVE